MYPNRYYSSHNRPGYGTRDARYHGAASGQPKIMQAKYAGRCADCGGAIAVGDTIRYASGQVRHGSQDVCRQADAQRAALAATLCSNGGEANRLAASAGAAFRGPQQATATIDLTPLRAFIQAAKDRGLKYPKLRVLDADGQTELALGLTVAGHNPGSVSVKRAGEYIGLIRPDGTAKGGITPGLAAHLLTIAAAPAEAAKRYATLMCRCSFCELPLTDEGSVEVGYGPTCAKRWGLPHKAKGTPSLAAPRDVEADERAMQQMEAEADRAQTARETFHTMMEVA